MPSTQEKKLPSPNSGESESDFVSRCMGNDAMQAEFPDQKQRAAVCYRQYREKVSMIAPGAVRILPKTPEVQPLQSENIDLEQRTIIATISTDRVDSDLDVVMPKGLDWSRFDKNPIVLFMHDPFNPIGKSLWRRVYKDRVTACTKFAKGPLPDQVFDLYSQDVMRGWSIGMAYNTIKRRPPNMDDLNKNPNWHGAANFIQAAQILEYSAASIPANEDALNRALKGGAYKAVAQLLDGYVPATKRVPTVKVLRINRPLTVVEAGEAIDLAIRRTRGYV